MTASVRVLGPVEVVTGRQSTPVKGRNARAVLVALVLGLDHSVPVDHLLVAVWGDDPPPSARVTLQGYVSALRQLLGPDAIEYEDDAYALRLSPDAVDSVRFERMLLDASSLIDGNADLARSLIMEALDLWRGRPFGDLTDDELVELESRRLEELRVAGMELRLEADIALGRDTHAAGLLGGLVREYPYRERLWYLYMTALAHDGRRVEALRAFRQVSELLAEVGLEPSQDLHDLEQRILLEAPDLRANLARGRMATSQSAEG